MPKRNFGFEKRNKEAARKQKQAEKLQRKRDARDEADNALVVETKDLPAMRIAGLRHVGSYRQIAPVFKKLGEVAGKARLFDLRGAMMVGLYHDDPRTVAENALRSDAGVIVTPDAMLPPELTEMLIPAATYVCTMHVGSYEGLPGTWERLMSEGLPSTGRRPSDAAAMELYHNDPTDTPPDELKTEICIPVVS